MAFLRFEGDMKTLSAEQAQFIREVLEKRGFKDNKVVFEPVGKAGDNYVASVKRITVEVENGDDFIMIAKIAPILEQLRLLMNTGVLFNNEAVMYSEVLPKLYSLQVEADIPEEERLRYVECYGCLTQAPHEVILLEDLKPLDFIMMDRLKPLNNDAVKLILKNFAILHSSSYALKRNEPETYTRYKNKLVDMWALLNMHEEYQVYLTQMEEAVLNILDSDKYRKYVKGALTQLNILGNKIRKHEANSKYLVIQQGDAWTNNIMFKLENDQVSRCIMIDYQLSKEANPACDLLYMIFNCTDYKTKSQHFYEWLDYYHECLDQNLANFGMKANFVYPRDQLDADIKRYARVFFGTSIMIFNFLIRKSEEAVVLSEITENSQIDKMMSEDVSGISTLCGDTISIYKTKVEELIDSCLEFGLI